MEFSNDNAVWSTPEDYNTSKMWTLSSGDGLKTVYVKFQDGAGNWSDAISDSITLQTVAPITTASPEGGTYTSAQSVTLTANKPATIYYTSNGTTPTTSSPVYSSPISITTTTTLKFFAVDNAGNSESVKTEIYTINIDHTPPVTSLGSSPSSPDGTNGWFKTIPSITLTRNESGTSYYSWTSSSGPWTTYSASFNAPIGVNTLYYYSVDTVSNAEAVKSQQFKIDPTAPTTAASPAGGAYTSAQSVTLTCSDGIGSSCDKIYYTTDGSTPTTSSPVYSSSISITTNKTLKFFATDMAGNQGGVRTEAYTIVPPPPSITLLSPNGSEIIPSGSAYMIQWSAPSNAVKFDLKYSMNNGTTWKSIATKITGTSYNWIVPCPNNNKKTSFVKVIGYNSFGAVVGQDVSNSTFTIEVVKILSPNGGEYSSPGTTQAITWRTNCTIRPVAKVELYYTTGGGIWNLITTRTINNGSYPWTLPYVSSTKYKVKVILKDSAGTVIGNDVSDKVFTIKP
jgi:hypothetical protein